MNIVNIICARGGSRRLNKKNIRLINKQPMINYSIAACKEVFYKNLGTWVSTEDSEISEISKKCDVNVIKRPARLSDPKISKVYPLRHAVLTIENQLQIKIDLVVSVQANSPQINSQVLERMIKKLLRFDLGEVCTVDNNLNQNAAARIFKRQNLFDEFYSTKFGLIKFPAIDIHDNNDLKKVREIMTRSCND